MRCSFSLALIVISFVTLNLPTTGFAQNQSDVETVSRSATEFAVDLYRQTRGEEENLFFSPYSIYTLLSLMYGGADRETAAQMAAALHVQLEPKDLQAAMVDIQGILSRIREKGEVELNIGNSLWPQTDGALVPEFLNLAAVYLAEVYQVNYRTKPEAVRARINSWAEEKTNGRIKEIVNWDLHPETHLLLANAIFLKATGQGSSRRPRPRVCRFALRGTTQSKCL